MRSLFLLFVFLGYTAIGIGVPFIATLGYVWVDLLKPQQLAWGIMTSIPVAAILFGSAFFGYLLFDRRSPPKVSALMILLCVFAVWVTMTTFWAEVPDRAWVKWDWAFKVLIFSIFVPFVIRSRVQIEAFLLTYLFSVSGVAIAFGVKTFFTGGAGYGQAYALNLGNSGIGESSTMAIACVMLIPVIFYMSKHSVIFRGIPALKYLSFGLAFLFLLAIIGSHARTGLVATAVIAGFYFLLSNRKFLFSVCVAFLMVASVPFLSDEWGERMQTIKTFEQDQSASNRIAVWRWTLGYVASNPLGGGFDAFFINKIETPIVKIDENGERRVEIVEQYGRAFHSNYFEVLGEHGWLGLVLYLAILSVTVSMLWNLRKMSAMGLAPGWIGDLSTALFIGLTGFLVGGAFVGIAFQPIFYHFASIAIALRQYVLRISGDEAVPSAHGMGRPQPAGRSYGW